MEPKSVITTHARGFTASINRYETQHFNLYFVRRTKVCLIVDSGIALASSTSKFYAFNLYDTEEKFSRIVEAMGWQDDAIVKQVKEDLDDIRATEYNIKLEGGYSLLL